MLRVKVRLFAAPREAVGKGELAVDVAEGASVADLLDALTLTHPPLAKWRGHLLVSVNRAFVKGDAALAHGDEVALLPPVSGGGEARLHAGELSVDAALAKLSQDGAGAAVVFLGLVRATSGEAPGARVDRLDLEAFEPLAASRLSEIAREAKARFDLTDATILHRLGTLATGEAIVLVATSAPHRKAAFEAAAWIMEALKTDVPIWKREVGPDGARWVNDPTRTT